MYINLDSILKERNKTRYWLSQTINVAYPNVAKLCDNKTTSIKFDIIEKICKALDCNPNDLFIIQP